MSSEAITRCRYCDRAIPTGQGWWHLHRCDARAKAVLAGSAPPLIDEATIGLLAVRTSESPQRR